MKRWLRLCLMALFAVAAHAQSRLTVDQLVTFVKSSLQLRHDDSRIASYIKKNVKLSNRLDARVVEDLQGMGVGPQTLNALRGLVTESATLGNPAPAPPKPVAPVIPAPDSIEQKRILADITDKARNYSKSLPNFICLQVTRRYGDNSGLENYHLLDTIAERLTYFEEKEDYQVVSINGVPAAGGTKHQQLNGATSSGEFGTLLKEIFSAETQTEFNWERWATLRGRRMHVFAFRVRQANSKYTIYADSAKRTVISGYHGLVYADRQTGMVMRIKMEMDNLPVDFPIQAVDLDLNYDMAKISGSEFLLPLKSEIRSREGKFLVRNEVEFRLYNRFGADTSIQFGDVPDALPADSIGEEPIK